MVEYGPDGRSREWTCAGLTGAARSVARRLAGELNLPAGGRVVVSGANSGAWIAAALGARMAGLTIVPLDAEYGGAERSNVTGFAEPHAVVCDPQLKDAFDSSLPLIGLDEIEPSPDEPAFDIRSLEDGQPFCIVFTSGTSARPKGVMLTEDNLLHNVRILSADPRLISHRDTILSLLPLHHVYAFTATMLTVLSVGCTVAFPSTLKPADIGEAARGENVTIMAVVPQVISSIRNRVIQEVKSRSLPASLAFKAMRAVGKVGIERGWRPGRHIFRSLHRRFGNLRIFACGGARLDEDVHRYAASLGFRIIEAYGLSETAPVVTLNDIDRPVFGSVGKPAPEVEVRLAEAGGGLDEREVLVRGPNVMAGYWRLPEETEKSFVDGWFRTGDLGRMDEDGNLFLTGRSKEVIVMPSGKNIYPGELEDVYAQGELVEEVCILLTEHEGREQLTAVVVPDREAISRRKISDISGEVRFDLENIAVHQPSYHRVNRVVITGEELPRTRLGKLKRYEVQNRLDELAREEAAPSEQGDASDPLLAFTSDRLNLQRVPTGREHLETDLGLDSLSKLDFISAVEQEFDVTLSDEEAASVVALDDLRPLIERGAEETEREKKQKRVELEDLVDTGHNRLWDIVRRVVHFLLRLALKVFYRARVEGLEHLPAKGPYLIAPNHVSYIDALLVHAMLPGSVSRRLFSVATAEIFDKWPFSQVSYRARIIKTGTLETAARSLQHARRLLEMGAPVCVFPEGKRSIDGKVDEPKSGLGLLAGETGVPVIPVYISGTDAFLSRANPGLHLSRVSVTFLPPLTVEDGGDLLKEWYDAMQRAESEHG